MLKFKRMTIAVSMVLILLLSACIGGGSNSKVVSNNANENVEAEETNKENSGEKDRSPYKIKILGNSDKVSTTAETPIGQVIKEKFNIEFELIPYSGDLKQKLNMMLAAGDYPELLHIEGQEIVKKYINAGAVIPLDPYLETASNFNERYEETIPFWRSASEDGKLYKWEYDTPQDINNFCECNDIAIRSDLLEEEGWPELRSTDDYVKFLKEKLEEHPSTNGNKTIGMAVPFAESWGMAGVSPIMYEKGDEYISVGNEGVIFNYKEKKFEDMFSNEYTKDSLKFFNRLYREGIISEESFTDTYEQVKEKLNSGQALSAFYSVFGIDGINRAIENSGNSELQYIKMPIQTNSQVEENQSRLLRLESTRPYSSVVITKNAKHPERIMELVDWIASEEGQLLLQSGIEGKHYSVEDGKRVPSEEFIDGALNKEAYLSTEGFSFRMLGYVRSSSPVDGQPYSLLNDSEIKDKLYLTDRVKGAYEEMGWEHSLSWWHENGEPAPSGVASAVSVDPASKVGKTHQKMVDLRIKNSARLISADSEKEFEEIWKDVMKQYEKLEPQTVIDEYNAIYEKEQSKVE
ncbi:extracellular solute-binding protein [Bacillus sp. P14.5]|uniref:extracellular solute-binding protein n=1 Tax=Bacillus sp. P14.5 TaxID=1983400 RepID=UPI000DEB5DAD|nr:extracellular solute-binding protein [Bacillus sp. P14.5]